MTGLGSRGRLLRFAWVAPPLAAALCFGSASAQVDEYEVTVFEAGGEGPLTGTKLTGVERVVRVVSPASYEAELEADGFKIMHPRAGRRSIRTHEEVTAARSEQVMEIADRLGSLDLMDVLVELPEIPFPELKGLDRDDSKARQRVLEEREAVILTAQDDFVEHAKLNGAESVRSMRLGNHVRITAPAGALVGILNHPDVVGVTYNGNSALADNDGYVGSEIREQTYIQELLDAGFDGESGGRANTSYGSDDIKIAVVEAWSLFRDTNDDCIPEVFPNDINDTHPGWKDCATCGSRLVVNERCSNGCASAPSSSAASHGTVTSWVAAGDLTDGQIPHPFQHYLTGVAPEVSLMYFRAEFEADFIEAIVRALFFGADVINLSASFSPGICFLNQTCDDDDFCDIEQNTANLNSYVQLLTDVGVLVVTSTGNTNNDQICSSGNEIYRYPNQVSCNALYPAWRSEVVAVGGIGEVPSEANNFNLLAPYTNEPIGDYSSRGFVSVGVGGSYSLIQPTVLIPVPTITAPGAIQWYFAEDDEFEFSSNDPVWSEPVQGTSWATPVVAAAAGLFRQAMGFYDARMLKALLLVMGDAEDSTRHGLTKKIGVSEVYGAGRLKAHTFAGLQTPAAGISIKQHLEEGEELSLFWPTAWGVVPAEVTQYKWATYIDAPDLSEVPWVIVSVFDWCTGSYVANDPTFGFHKYFSIEGSALDNACYVVKTYAYSAPAGGVDVYHVGYYHSGDPDEH